MLARELRLEVTNVRARRGARVGQPERELLAETQAGALRRIDLAEKPCQLSGGALDRRHQRPQQLVGTRLELVAQPPPLVLQIVRRLRLLRGHRRDDVGVAGDILEIRQQLGARAAHERLGDGDLAGAILVAIERARQRLDLFVGAQADEIPGADADGLQGVCRLARFLAARGQDARHRVHAQDQLVHVVAGDLADVGEPA